MARSTSRSLTNRSQVKSQLAALRKRGLTVAKPRGRPGGSAYALIRKLKPILDKKAQAIKLSPEGRKKYAGQFPIAKGKAIVSVAKGERVSFAPKSAEIRRVKRIGKSRFSFRVLSKDERMQATFRLPGDENTVYRFHSKSGFVNTRIGRQEAEKFISSYDVGAFIDNIEIVSREEEFDEEEI